MEIYFVRHGQTSGNAAKRHQAEDSPLTPFGEEQVRNIAKDVKEIKPTHLVTSPLVRALETARVIGQECELIPSISHAVRELERPQRLYGNYQFTFDSLSLYIRWYFSNQTGYTEKYGETYASLRERIAMFQHELNKFPQESRVVVVSHGVFINFFLAHMCYPDRMKLHHAVHTFGRIVRTPNTAVIPVFYDPDREKHTCPWFVQ